VGWLRESMSQAGLRSFGELARLALGHPEWPEDSRAQPRSLEAIFGRLDKREDLDWLSDRPGIQQILAELLKISVSEVRTILVDAQGARPTVTRLRFDDIRAARGFDLTQEPLPPTVPERVGLPATWSRCCWIANAGAGMSLVGQWLAARALAQSATIETLDELHRLPLSGPPLYLELPVELLDALTHEWHGTQPLCVAVASHGDPQALVRRLPQSYSPLHSSPVEQCLEQIVDWVLFRLAGRPRSRRQPLLTWLREGPSAWGLVQTLGDALGLIGAFVDGSVEPSQAATKEALLRQWMAHRTAELARERHRDLSAMRQTLPEVLVDMAQAVLIDDARGLLAARTIDEWLALVPEHHRRGPDIDWLTTRLVSDNLPMRKPDLERAVQRLPPGAHRIVVAFRELSVIRPTSATRFAVRPHFLGRLVDAIARERIVAAAPLFWGEALLRPTARASLLPTLTLRAGSQPESLAEDVLEHVDLVSPALVCAFETSFVLLGLAVLGGAELSDQVAASLLEEQAAVVLTSIDAMPTTRMLPSEPAGLTDLPGTFYLAAWALSEHSRIRGASLHPALDPWHSTELPTAWPSILDSVAHCIQAALPEEPSWLNGAIRLLDRVRQSIGTEVGPAQRKHELFLAGAVIDAIELGVLDWPELETILNQPFQYEFFLLSIAARSTTAGRLTQAIFSAWSEAGSPPTGYQLFSRWPKELLCSAPAALVAHLLLTPECPLPSSECSDLPSSAWQAWLEARGSILLQHEPAGPWEVAPATVVEQALATRPPTSESIRRIVWARHARLAIRQVENNRTLQPQAAADWLQVAPVDLGPTLAEYGLSEGWLHAADIVSVAFQRLLHRCVAERVNQWRAAYDCLHQMETERRRFAGSQ
jgi:hypothetical protein